MHAQRSLSSSSGSGGSPKSKEKATPQFGKAVAADDNAPGQLMHDITKGRFDYIGDFMNSLNRGPVKLEYGKDAKPLSEKERRQDEEQEQALRMIQRSMLIGSLMAVGGCALGWQLCKWYYGVKNMQEFNLKMKERMPKVSGSLEDSMLGQRLKETSEKSSEAISESPELTDWRRSLRSKFNSPEGAALARQNSINLRNQRETERMARKSGAIAQGSVTARKPASDEPLEDEPTPRQDGTSSVTGQEGEQGTTRLRRTTSRVLVDLEKGGSDALQSGAELVRTTSRVIGKSVKRLKTMVSQNEPPEAAVSPSDTEPRTSSD